MTAGQGLRGARSLLLPIAFVVLLAVGVNWLYAPRMQTQGVINWKQTGGTKRRQNQYPTHRQSESHCDLRGADGGIYLNSRGICAGTERGVYYSSTAGQRWEPRNEGLVHPDVLAGHLARKMGKRFHDCKQGESAWTIQTFS